MPAPNSILINHFCKISSGIQTDGGCFPLWTSSARGVYASSALLKNQEFIPFHCLACQMDDNMFVFCWWCPFCLWWTQNSLSSRVTESRAQVLYPGMRSFIRKLLKNPLTFGSMNIFFLVLSSIVVHNSTSLWFCVSLNTSHGLSCSHSDITCCDITV